LLSSDAVLGSIYRSPSRPRNNTTVWWRKGWASSINQGSPSLLSKTDTNTPAIGSDPVAVEIALGFIKPRAVLLSERCSINLCGTFYYNRKRAGNPWLRTWLGRKILRF